MADAGKEEMRVAFAQKVAQLKLELDFTQLHSKESFADLVACLVDWDTLSGGERAERTVSIYGEANRSKGYKLAGKFQLLMVNDVPHVLEKFGKGGQVPVALGGAAGEEETFDAVDVRRLVPEDALFDVLWATHVDAGGHCKSRTFDDRVRRRFIGIPRCLHAAPSHPTSSYTLLPHPTPVPSHLTAPFYPTPTPLPSHCHPTAISYPCLSLSLPLPSSTTPGGCCWRLSDVALSARAESPPSRSRWLGLIPSS